MMKQLGRMYLILYNVVCCIGWSMLLKSCVEAMVAQNTQSLYARIETTLKITQSLALCEILHAMVGLVRSPVSSTILQVGSRIYCVWAVAHISIESQVHWGFTMMVTSWSLVEVPRYAFYAMNAIGWVPSPLFFLRYHLFMLLYPTGCSGELLSMWNTVPYLVKSGAYAITLPNRFNFSCSLLSIMYGTMFAYLAGLPVMYSHMLKQRNRAYSKLKKEKSA